MMMMMMMYSYHSTTRRNTDTSQSYISFFLSRDELIATSAKHDRPSDKREQLVTTQNRLAFHSCCHTVWYARNMRNLTVIFTYLPKLLLLLLLLLMLFDRCESLTDSSLPPIFFPFGGDEGDSVVRVGSNYCTGPISIPYEIFDHRTIYVSCVDTCPKQK